MNNINQQMALIQILDSAAHLSFSSVNQWWVTARIEIKQGGLLTPPLCCGITPEAAVNLFLCDITATNAVVVTDAYRPSRREWKWNRMAGSWEVLS